MTNPNHYYHHQKQEDATRATTSHIVVKATSTSQSATLEAGDSKMTSSPVLSTAPNSASSSPLSFNYSEINNNSSNSSINNDIDIDIDSNTNIMMTTDNANLDASGGIPATHQDQHPQPDLAHRFYNSSAKNNNHNHNHDDTFSRGPLSPQSAPPNTSRPGGWTLASASTSPVPSVIHTARAALYGSTPCIPSINRSGSGNTSTGSVSSSSNLIAKKTSTKVTGKKKHQISKPRSGSMSLAQTTSSPGGGGTVPTGQKKQRRLERNRLSAQLSRRRRKHYLEELEERVVQLSLGMDSGRRAHAFQALGRISEMRQQVLMSAEAVVREIESSSDNSNGNSNSNNDNRNMMLEYQLDNSLRLLEKAGPLSRTNSEELLVLNSFLGQQLKSFSLPSHAKFILWLTLQGDIYYRGGRAASERLSAARIGERMLANGNDKVTPTNAMWPLVCNEVGLSYELEERLRNYQRTVILQEKNTWLDRHTARSSALVMQSFHDSVGGMAQMVGRRESEMNQGILTPSQRVKYLAWAHKHSARIKARLEARRQREDLRLQQQQQAMKIKTEETDANNIDIGKYVDSKYSLNQSHHLAANLYILNHQLHMVLKDFPYQSPSNLTPTVLKKLMRRASFESLGQQKDADGRALSREDSFASSGSMLSYASNCSLMNFNGSLMKSGSNISWGESAGNGSEDSERPATLNQITPQIGEQAAVDTVDQAIGFVKPIIPPILKPITSAMPVVYVSAPFSSHMTGTAPTQDTTSARTMDYHNHHVLVPAPVNSYGDRAPLAPAPPSNQHVAPMHHLPPRPPAQLEGHNYSASPITSSQVQHAYQNYQQPNQPQTGHYYPPQNHIHYAPTTAAPTRSQSLTSIDPQPIAPVYETLSCAIQQQPPPPPDIKSRHVRTSSFLPPHLNVVPEDMFPGVDATAADFFELQDCLMDAGDDWGIGVGLDMDTTA